MSLMPVWQQRMKFIETDCNYEKEYFWLILRNMYRLFGKQKPVNFKTNQLDEALRNIVVSSIIMR